MCSCVQNKYTQSGFQSSDITLHYKDSLTVKTQKNKYTGNLKGSMANTGISSLQGNVSKTHKRYVEHKLREPLHCQHPQPNPYLSTIITLLPCIADGHLHGLFYYLSYTRGSGKVLKGLREQVQHTNQRPVTMWNKGLLFLFPLQVDNTFLWPPELLHSRGVHGQRNVCQVPGSLFKDSW